MWHIKYCSALIKENINKHNNSNLIKTFIIKKNMHEQIFHIHKHLYKLFIHKHEAKQKNMCVYGRPTDPIFQPLTLTFLIGNYSTLIFASDPINFYTEFG